MVVQVDQRRDLLDPGALGLFDERAIQEQPNSMTLMLRRDANIVDVYPSSERQYFIGEEETDNPGLLRRDKAITGIQEDGKVRTARYQVLFL